MTVTFDNVTYWIEQQTDYNVLMDINRRVCARARRIQTEKAQKDMVKFHIGQKVKFRHKSRGFIVCIIEKLNVKTATCKEVGTGEGWRVHPRCLLPAE